MAVTLNASTASGLIATSDTSGNIELQNNGTTVLGVTSTGASVTGTQSVSGNLSFNSGYGSSAVAYGCRAWVNFNGTTNTGGFCTIRASGNVTSVADNGTGEYTVTLTNAMPDANYAPVASDFFYGETITGALTTTTFKVYTYNQGSPVDASSVYVAVFR
jgi:hypothetical protein